MLILVALMVALILAILSLVPHPNVPSWLLAVAVIIVILVMFATGVGGGSLAVK